MGARLKTRGARVVNVDVSVLAEAPRLALIFAVTPQEALAVLQAATDLEWTFFAPAAMIGPGVKTGTYRIGVKQLISDAEGRSAISYNDYADAFVTEIELAGHPRQILTVAY